MAGEPTAERTSVQYKSALQIRADERDRSLGVNEPTWPASPPDEWDPAEGMLSRIIQRDGADPPRIPAPLEELVLRFPSAPVHGLQRLHDHHVILGSSENFHTFRVLRSADPEDQEKPIGRIFLMHTGLNEWDRMGLYYRLSSQLIAREPTTVCIVRPFPGHLTRYPFQAFAETPLDYYLRDGSHLFRQFMRFMLETQWFLSTIARRSSYRCASGANLLGEKDGVEGSRLETACLAEEIERDWLRLHAASAETAKLELDGDVPERPPVSKPVERQQFVDAIETLRGVLNLDTHFPPQGGDLNDSHAVSEPKIHVLGYSLGGFTAQSVFMSWPFLIASCSTVLAGGALRELAPTGFADPEEWQTVLHSLRYELDDRMMSEHLVVDDETVAGIDRELFTHLKRTFYEVFQQEYRGSIQTRYEAFRDRMLFIVGGNDPVVRPETVLQSGPKGGLNLLEIGGLGHFFSDSGGDRAEKQQRTFWLPEMATLIHRFSDNAAEEQDLERPFTWFDEDLSQPKLTREEWNTRFLQSREKKDDEASVRPLTPAEAVAIQNDGALTGELFERSLDDLLYRVAAGEDGVLFVLRNEMPTVMLPPSAIREVAAALYHDDFSIVRYCHGVTARREILEKCIDKICLVLPWNAHSIMRHMDVHRAYPSQAEGAGGGVAKREPWESIWKYSLDSCYALAADERGRESIRRFDGNAPVTMNGDEFSRVVGEAQTYTGREPFGQVPSLPDCWVWISRALLTNFPDAPLDMERGIGGLIRVVAEASESASLNRSSTSILRELREEHIRIVNVSRARYNPRFRGRLVVDGSAARKRLIHVALCVAMSQPIADIKPSLAFS